MLHMLIECEFSKRVLDQYIKNFNIPSSFPPQLGKVPEMEATDSGFYNAKWFWQLAPLTIVWTIWKERNSKTFKCIENSWEVPRD